jgi:hypothetical protein|tara:strand:+ start:458 stop:946 length:489 start_codon:yes stop_codon:yes gene_type:complete
MSWFTILKISSEDAIRDAERFAPEIIAEQKKLDEEEKRKALELANQAEKEKYYVEPSQLPRMGEYKEAGSRFLENNFLLKYIPFFLTDSEFSEYKKKTGRTNTLYRIYDRIFEEDKNSPKLDEIRRELREITDAKAKLAVAAAWRWKHYGHGKKRDYHDYTP